MAMVIVHDPLTAKLAGADAPLEVYASDGRLLGYFTPAKPGRTLQLEKLLSEEELARREAAGGGRPLADILRDLEAQA